MSNDKHAPDNRLPIKVDTASNGEFMPQPLERHNVVANAWARDQAQQNAKRLGLSRRSFLTSTCGAASTLLAFNEAHAAFGQQGSYFDIPRIAAVDQDAATHALGKQEFIFDIQGHFVNPAGKWRDPGSPWSPALAKTEPQASCGYSEDVGELRYMGCFDGRAYAKEVFLDSDTDIAVLTFVPTTYDSMPLTIEEAAATRDVIEKMQGSHRLLLHGRVIPNLPGDLDRMSELAEQWKISAWKTYTQYGPTLQSGWWLDDDEFGAPLIERARKLGVKVICIHKGLPLRYPLMGKDNYNYGSCRDVGPVAKKNPDMTFIVYHSGYIAEVEEGPFVPGSGKDGIDTLVQSLIDAGVKPNSNVYAELGSTWRQLMKKPNDAAHAMGKLLKYVGENNVVWGTDCIWYGSPQDQIQAFRAFQISEPLQEKYGYPAMTPTLRAKIFGLNATVPYQIDVPKVRTALADDLVDRERANYANNPNPSFLTYGPKTRREFLRFKKLSEG